MVHTSDCTGPFLENGKDKNFGPSRRNQVSAFLLQLPNIFTLEERWDGVAVTAWPYLAGIISALPHLAYILPYGLTKDNILGIIILFT
jgi:hypothetical protein